MKLFEDGDWYIYVYDNYNNMMCLRHINCKRGGDGCACTGYCKACNVEAPDEMKGFFELVRWQR